MNIEYLEAFVYVVHFNSFHKAADALYLSQPAISHRIQMLERELMVHLLDRNGKQFTLTEKGKQFLPYAQKTLQSYQKGKEFIQTEAAPATEIRIGCTESVSNYIIPIILPAFKQRFPSVRLRIVTGSSDDITEKVLAKELEMGLVRSVAHPALDSSKFFEDPIKLYVYEGHPLLQQESATIKELEKTPLVFYECGSLNWIRIHRLFESLDSPPRIDFHIDNMEAAKKLILQKLGIGFLPTLCTHQEVNDGKLFPVEIASLSKLSLSTNLISRKSACPEAFAALLDTRKKLTQQLSAKETGAGTVQTSLSASRIG
ncbi:LysR family transcriptional regulator [Paenibacillus sp. NPDC058071]|uniref:LysR family transcriptional regulator n=1 Tax=Paenibacillus sp. NPDC058071 TaxID=3346326 RepID=UPI0036DDE500